MNPLDAITIDLPELRSHDVQDGHRVWYTPDGDGVGLFHFERPPDLPGDPGSLAALRMALSRFASAAGAAVIEVSVTSVDGCTAVRQCVKVPQQPTGMTYIASLVIPFRDFFYVIKIQCEERGITGVREAFVLDEKLGSGEVDVDPEHGGMVGWMKDPYDADRSSGLAFCLADAPEYDARFPDHPLSRARRFLDGLESHVTVRDDVRTAAPFVYGSGTQRNKPWWKLW